MADNLKMKAEELVQRRVNREMRKHTEDLTLEKLFEKKGEEDYDSGDEKNITPRQIINIKKLYRHHKNSVAKPLTEDSEDDATPMSMRRSPHKSPKDFRVSDNVSRLMDDKRSTIKEQVEDEEEFTGSSLNISGNLQFIKGSKRCKHKDSEPRSKSSKKTSLRKNSDNIILSDQSTPIGIFEKPRKYTENMMEVKKKPVRKRKKENENEKSTTIEGTSVITPFMQSRKDSGFGEIVSSMISTPILQSSPINRKLEKRVLENPSSSSQTKTTIFRSLASGIRDRKMDAQDPAP